MEYECRPQMLIIDDFLPKLLYLLKPHWKSLDNIYEEYKDIINKLTEEDFKDPEGKS